MKKLGKMLTIFAITIITFFAYGSVRSAEVDTPAYPSTKISSIPETFQADSEITLTVEQDGFTGDNLFSNWCIDGVPLNSFYAGADDKITFDEVQQGDEIVYIPRVQNKYGRLIGGGGFCNSPVRPINADSDNANWWRNTNIANIETPQILFGGLGLNDTVFTLSQTALALLIGMEKEDSSMNPTFLIPEFRGEVVPSQNPSDLHYLEDAELKDLAKLVGLEETDTLIDNTISYLIVKPEDAVSIANNVKDEGYGVFDYPSDFSILYIDLSNVPDSVSNNYKLGDSIKLPIYDSYRIINVKDAPTEETNLEASGYEVDILWDTVEKKLKADGTDDLDSEGNPQFNVHIRLYEPIEVNLNVVAFQQYWQETFNEPYLFEGDQNEVGRAYSELFYRFSQSTWGENRSYWYDRGMKENPIFLSRTFHILDDEDNTHKEGDLYDDGSAYSDLPSYKDRDRDGIPDLWEMKNFGALAGKEITKPSDPKQKAKKWFPVSCCAFGDTAEEKDIDLQNKLLIFLQDVSPTDDWDGDGFDWRNRSYREWKNKYRSYPEPWTAGLGPYIERNRVIGDYAGSFNKPGDKKLTNYEEYVMGTNPIEPDTDGDGVPDELDFYGLSQETIKLKLNKDVGNDDYLITARSYGPINRGSYKDQPHFGRADAIRNIKQAGELPLEIQLSVSPDPATLPDEITVNAGVGNTNTVDSKLLFFQWYLNDIPIQSPPGEKLDQACPCTPEAIESTKLLGEQSGYGKTSLTFPASLGASSACNAAKVFLEVTDPSTEQTVTSEIQVPIMMEAVLTKSIVGNTPEDGEGVGVGVLGDDQSVEDVSPDQIGGVRANDLVEITANLVGYNPAFCGTVEVKDEQGNVVVPATDQEQQEQYMNSLTYIWNIDGTERSDLSGKGRRVIQFELSALARTTSDNRDVQGSASDADDDTIAVEIYDADKNLISKTEEGIKVLPPYIDFNVIGTGVKRMPTTADGNSEIQLLANSSVTLGVSAQYLKPATDYVFTWTRHNTKEESVSTTPIGEYNFIAGGDEGFPNSEDITVVITSRNEKGEEIETVNKNFYADVVDNISFANTSTSGFISKFIPNNLRGIINFSAVFSCVVLIILLTYNHRRHQKNIYDKL